MTVELRNLAGERIYAVEIEPLESAVGSQESAVPVGSQQSQSAADYRLRLTTTDWD
jgi:hypothetical protein